MTAPTRQTRTAVARTDAQSTAVAQADERDASLERAERYGNMPVHARAEVIRARTVREVSDMVALTEWGSKLSDVGRAAMAKWCIRRDVDPLTELDNVGGPYINAEHWIRKLGELRVRGIVRDVEQINIANDPRLAALAKDENAPTADRDEAKVEHYRRLKIRIQYNVPEEATGACLTLIHLTAGGEPIPGVKWGGGGTSVKQPRSGGGSAPNPVVEANPALSVESQSIRRAMRQLALKLPQALPEFQATDEDTPDLKALAATEPPMMAERGTALAQPDDPYGDGRSPAVDANDRPIPRTTPVAAASDAPNDGELPLGDRRATHTGITD